jgi:N-acetylglucosamine-6-phosphate deacetylase
MTSPPDGPVALRGRLLIGGALVRGAVVMQGGLISEVVLEAQLAAGRLPARVLEAGIITPGLIDLQVNGGFGLEVGADAGALRALAARLPSTGVTAFLPTLISRTPAQYRTAFAAFEDARDAAGARPLGLHLEGPFMATARAGAHPREAIERADPALFDEAITRGLLRLVTLAPERPGAVALIGRLRARGVVVSLGHSDASCEDFRRGVDAGASMATHLYNAMSPFRHRAPGAVGAALTDDRIVASLIADGVHCHPIALALALRAKGADRLALVTDATAAAGLGPGLFTLGGQTIISDGRTVCLSDTTLAGSALTLDQAVRNFVAFTGAPPEQPLHMATAVPARLLGLDTKGRLARGCDADLVLWSDDLRVVTTFMGGRTDAQGWAAAAPGAG